MTLTLELTPETEKRLAEEAARRGQSPTDTVLRLLEEILPPSQGKEGEEGAALETDGLTAGARVIAELRAEGVIGLFADRPEDSPELARKFQEEAQKPGSQRCS